MIAKLKSPGSNPSNVLKILERDKFCCGDSDEQELCAQYIYIDTDAIPSDTIFKIEVNGVDYVLANPVLTSNAQAVKDAIIWALSQAGYSSDSLYVAHQNNATYIYLQEMEDVGIQIHATTAGIYPSIDVCPSDDLVAVQVRFFIDSNGDEAKDANEAWATVLAIAYADNAGTIPIQQAISEASGIAMFWVAKTSVFYVDFDQTLDGDGASYPTTRYKEIVVDANGNITYTGADWPGGDALYPVRPA